MDGCCRVLKEDEVEGGALKLGMIDNGEVELAPEWEAEDKANDQRSIRTVYESPTMDMTTYS